MESEPTPPTIAASEERPEEELLALKEEKLKAAISDVETREKGAYHRSVLITALSFALGLGWLLYSGYQVRQLDREYDKKSFLLNATADELADKQRALADVKQVLDNCRQGPCDPEEVNRALGFANTGLNVGDVVALSTPVPTPTPTATPTPTPRNSPTPAGPTPTPRPTPSPQPPTPEAGFVGGSLYRGADGTRVTVYVTDENLSSQYYALNGKVIAKQPGQPFSFTLNKGEAKTINLVMLLRGIAGTEIAVKIVASDRSVLESRFVIGRDGQATRFYTFEVP